MPKGPTLLRADIKPVRQLLLRQDGKCAWTGKRSDWYLDHPEECGLTEEDVRKLDCDDQLAVTDFAHIMPCLLNNAQTVNQVSVLRPFLSALLT